MQTLKYVTMDENKVYCWCTTNTLKVFRDFMQYILDGCDKPEDFWLWDIDNDKVYNAYQIAIEVYGMRKRTFDERMCNIQTGKWFIYTVNNKEILMKRLREWIETWIEGKQVRGIKSVSPATIWELIDIYNAIVRKEKPSFINGTVKEILDKCGIKTTVEGIGWKIL